MCRQSRGKPLRPHQSIAGLIGVLLLVFLAGCQQLQPKDQAASTDTWSMKATAIIKTSTEAKRLFIYWRQDRDKFDIRLTASLGVSVAHLVGDKAGVYIDIPKRDRQYAQTADQLLEDLTGYAFPITSLKYWLRGTKEVPDQGPWQLKYLTYENGLPTQILLTHPEVSIKLKISDWR